MSLLGEPKNKRCFLEDIPYYIQESNISENFNHFEPNPHVPKAIWSGKPKRSEYLGYSPLSSSTIVSLNNVYMCFALSEGFVK